MTLATPADLMQEACDLLAVLLPRLERETAESSAEGPAPGMTGRPAAAPLPGNPPAFFAYTSIHSSARWAEGLLLYALGASERDERRGGSDANTVRVLTEVIPKLAAGLDGDEAYGMVLRELDQRVSEAQSVRAIDEAERWRPVPQRPCPYCRCFFLRVLIDSRGQPAGRVGCFGHLESGEPCRAAWASLAEIAQDLERAETVAGPGELRTHGLPGDQAARRFAGDLQLIRGLLGGVRRQPGRGRGMVR